MFQKYKVNMNFHHFFLAQNSQKRTFGSVESLTNGPLFCDFESPRFGLSNDGRGMDGTMLRKKNGIKTVCFLYISFFLGPVSDV